MCTGSSKVAKKAAAAQKAQTTDMVSKTNSTVKTNDNAESRSIYSLRIPLSSRNQTLSASLADSYGLNKVCNKV